MADNHTLTSQTENSGNRLNEQLYNDVCGIIEDARHRVATYVNSEVCMMNWHVGKRIKEDVLCNKRADYGKQIIKNLATRLTLKYGKGWSEKSLKKSPHCGDFFRRRDSLCDTETIHMDTHQDTFLYKR